MSSTVPRGVFRSLYIINLIPINNTKDSNARESLYEIKKTLDEIVIDLSNIFNIHMTDRYGDTFYGSMGFGTGGSLTIPIYSADPTSPVNGQIWYNSTSNTFKCRQGGVTKTFTTT